MPGTVLFITNELEAAAMHAWPSVKDTVKPGSEGYVVRVVTIAVGVPSEPGDTASAQSYPGVLECQLCLYGGILPLSHVHITHNDQHWSVSC